VPGLASGTTQGTLPWSWYSDSELLRHEQERIFQRGWQYVGPAEHAGEPVEELLAFDDQVGLEDRALVDPCRRASAPASSTRANCCRRASA
jgi:phenylpropionate dioxygenase-like ring-hydroxylating dioxygenase large terminal subunit